MLRKVGHQFERLPLRLDDRLSREVLRPGEHVKPPKIRTFRCDLGEQRRHLVSIDAKWLRPAAHAHPGGLEVERRVDAHGGAHPFSEPMTDRGGARELPRGFDVERHPRTDRQLKLEVALARPREADVRGIGSGCERDAQLARRGDIEPVHLPRHPRHERGHRVRLHRVVDADLCGQRGAQVRDFRGDNGAVVNEQRRASACGRHPLGHRPACDREFAVLLAEQRMDAVIAAHWTCLARSTARSILPFGLRGSSVSQMKWRGTM